MAQIESENRDYNSGFLALWNRTKVRDHVADRFPPHWGPTWPCPLGRRLWPVCLGQLPDVAERFYNCPGLFERCRENAGARPDRASIDWLNHNILTTQLVYSL